MLEECSNGNLMFLPILTPSQLAAERDIYSALAVEPADKLCVLERQLTAPQEKKKAKSVTDFRLTE